ncbi:hypothetical protein RHGRI_022310 [Rhododendron griersonianum]|uniref:Ribonucleotide reductase large subunit C-terminal domain-containing protein n=1 Tax=Rhododendron griersonianum TaxID=479676 RepID=A0AAV6J3W7_9ERIC|nr:hypothetical protein RHGRI_022310 [Rhododendron griersonianum]
MLFLQEEHRARDLFYAIWVPDLFMKRVESNREWSLFCPNEAPGLGDCWGEDFENLYTQYERKGKAKKVVSAQNLWFEILKPQIETGTPYMLFKGVPIESHPSKLVGSRGSNNRYFDFDKLAEGILQPDMWGVTPSNQWDWNALRGIISKNGVRNSLDLVAPMPTASTSQILGNNECFEPYTSNIYSRRSEFGVVNKHLLNDLTEMGLWSPAVKNQIIYENGSVQKIPTIPAELKDIYKYGFSFLFSQ